MPRWMRRKRDPWDRVLAEHITTEMPAGKGRPWSSSDLDRRWLIGGAAAVAVLLVAVGVLAALTVINNSRASQNLERADRWQERSEELSDLVSVRTRSLNRQTARLNVASNRLRSARRSIQRSEADVATLEQRQSELADEKAAIEDERGDLATVVVRLDACRLAVVDAYNELNAGFDPGVLVDTANATCAEAETVADAYLATYGAP